ncbi:rcc01693 family protein [Xanthobacteraceae bacterium A53D]
MSAAPARAFPWEAAMGFALGHLRLAPAAFWAMTPRELSAAARAHHGPAVPALDRAGLGALMARFPD